MRIHQVGFSAIGVALAVGLVGLALGKKGVAVRTWMAADKEKDI